MKPTPCGLDSSRPRQPRRETRTREEVLAKESERLAREDADLRDLERRLRDALASTGVPQGLPVGEALLALEAGRRRAATFRRPREHELPARREAETAGDPAELAERPAALAAEVARRRGGRGGPPLLPAARPRRPAAPPRTRVPPSPAEEDRARPSARSRRRPIGGDTAGRRGGSEISERFLARATVFRTRWTSRANPRGGRRVRLSDFRRGLSGPPGDPLDVADALRGSGVLRRSHPVGAREGRARRDAGRDRVGPRQRARTAPPHGAARGARYLGTGAAGVRSSSTTLSSGDDERFVAVMRFLATGSSANARPRRLVPAWRREAPRGARRGVRAPRRVSLAPFSTRPGAVSVRD